MAPSTGAKVQTPSSSSSFFDILRMRFVTGGEGAWAAARGVKKEEGSGGEEDGEGDDDSVYGDFEDLEVKEGTGGGGKGGEGGEDSGSDEEGSDDEESEDEVCLYTSTYMYLIFLHIMYRMLIAKQTILRCMSL